MPIIERRKVLKQEKQLKRSKPSLSDIILMQHSQYKAREMNSKFQHEFCKDDPYNQFLRKYNEVVLIINQCRQQAISGSLGSISIKESYIASQQKKIINLCRKMGIDLAPKVSKKNPRVKYSIQSLKKSFTRSESQRLIPVSESASKEFEELFKIRALEKFDHMLRKLNGIENQFDSQNVNTEFPTEECDSDEEEKVIITKSPLVLTATNSDKTVSN